MGTGKIFALKFIEKSNLNAEELKVLENEIAVMQILTHRNIVSFHEGWEGYNSFNQILEYIEGQDLYEYITDKGPLNENVTRSIAVIIIDTLKAIHGAGVIHRDMKPENIMIKIKNDKIKDLKIIDFGFAIFVDDLNEETLKAGTLNYMAPEILEGKKYGFEIDVFALGVILYFLMSGELPFYTDDNEMIVKRIIESDYELNSYALKEISDEGKDFLKQMLLYNPDKRITLK